MGFEVVQIEVGLLQNFNYLVIDSATRKAAAVDPAFEVDRLLELARLRNLEVTAVLITHTHHDHIEGADAMVRATGARLYVGAGEAAAAARAASTAEIVALGGGESIAVGDGRIESLSTPGHTVAGTSYRISDGVFTGDTLFIGGCGRTDFSGGDPHILWQSLQRLAELPEETRVYPGHDYGPTPTSTIGWERSSNPYLLSADEAAFVALRTGKNPPRPQRGER